MRHAAYLVALVLLIPNGCLGVPIDANEKGVQFTYSYEGYVDTGSSACDYRLGRWSVRANLIVQSFQKLCIFQLDDVSTGLFNGNKEDLNYTLFKDIPKEAEVLKLPFVLNTETFAFYVAANDPLWSVNFKRGISSYVQKIQEGKHQQKSVFGNCETNTEIKKNGLIIKTINHKSCEGVPYKHISNVRPAPGSGEHSPITRNTTIEILNKDDEPIRINSTSTVSYESMPNVPYNQFINQYQEFNLQHKSFDFNRIDTNSLVVEKKIFFEYGERTTQQRHKYETDTEVLIEQFFEAYNKFEENFKANTVENRQNTTEDPIKDMFVALYNIPDEEGIIKLRENIVEKGKWNLISIFVSLLPYVGTDQAVKYISNSITKSTGNFTRFYATTLMATFPQYIREPTNELVQSLEGLLNVTNPKILQTGGLLSFASVVARSHQQKYLSDENLEKYKSFYYEKFLGNNDQKIYLLGLINMADCLSYDFKISIITNTSLSANFRSLAIVGFKHTLKTGDPNNLFAVLWPIVQNTKENQDVRVEALDLLLSSNLSEEQFNIMLQTFKENSYVHNYVSNKHVANYFLTCLESMQNNTAYKESLSDLATATIEKEHFPVPSRPWTTGNYRLSYSDKEPNLGGYIHARTIANPILNSPSTIQLSFNQFAWSFDTGVYSVYIKLQGVVENIYKIKFFKQFRKSTTLPDLAKLLKEFNNEIKESFQDMHIDFIVFIDNKAVFTTFDSKYTNDELSLYLMELSGDTMFDVSEIFTITHPVMDYTQMPSILGTPINIKNDMQYISSASYINNDFKYRSSWYYQTWLESYNPVLDTTVSSYKYYGNEININNKISINPQRLVAAWLNQKDSMSCASDKLIGTTVDDKELLLKFCPICEGVAEIPTSVVVYDPRLIDLSGFGIKVNYTHEQFEIPEGPSDDFYTGFTDVHLSNSYVIPYAKPLLVGMHFYRHMYFLKPEISRVHYNAVPLVDNGTLTFIHVELNTGLSKIVDPFEDVQKNITIFVNNKVFGQSDEVESNITEWKLQYDFSTTHNYIDEHGKEKLKFAQNIFFKNDGIESGMQVCSSRVELLPAVRSDKFSILSPEDATALNIIKIKYRNNETQDWDLQNCESNRTITLTELYTTHVERNKEIEESANYQKCLEESKDFKFTPPTRSCISTFIASSRYDRYTVDMSLEKIAGMTETINKSFSYDKIENNKIVLSFQLDPFVYMFVDKADEFFNYTSYFPYKSRHPRADAYGDHDIITGFKRSCIITPKNIRSFMGRNIPNNKEKQVAFVECFEGGQSGLTLEKISDTHVGFKFWSENNVVEASFRGNKLKVALNGEDIKESHTDEDEKIRIRFLDEDVILVANEKLSIYYNTEYIYIKALSLYNELICGVCSQN